MQKQTDQGPKAPQQQTTTSSTNKPRQESALREFAHDANALARLVFGEKR